MRTILLTAASACLLAACSQPGAATSSASAASAPITTPAAPTASPPVASAATPVVAAPAPGAAVSAIPAGWTTQTSRELGVTFALPPGRTIGACSGDYVSDEGVPCLTVTGRVAGERRLTTYLQMTVRPGALEAVASANAGFIRNEQGRLMTTFGRFAAQPVENFTTPAGAGLRAGSVCGMTDDDGSFHAAEGSCETALVGDGSRVVMTLTDGRWGEDADTLRIIDTVRFLPTR